MLYHRLNEGTIGTAKVVVDILPKGKVIPNTTIKPSSITIHNTGNIGASAVNNHKYMKNLNRSGDRTASWHFTVDDKFIYQAVPCNKKAWHAGNATGNNTSIGIEICMFNDKERMRIVYKNAIELVKILMKYYGMTINDVVRHYDWSKKDCPTWLISGKFGFSWNWFKQQVAGNKTTTAVFKPYLARCNATSLNCRKGPGTNYGIQTQIEKGIAITITDEKEVNGTKWGKSKSGYWVCLKYMSFVRYV